MANTVTTERRASPRTTALGDTGMDRARLRPGRSARIVDLSSVGALIETDWRLLPGMRVELHVGEPVVLFRVPARILRCHDLDGDRVERVDPGDGEIGSDGAADALARAAHGLAHGDRRSIEAACLQEVGEPARRRAVP